VIRQALAVSFALALWRGSCGDVDSPPSSVNAPCTRSRDCKQGLACVRGVCAPPDPSDAAAPEDAGDG